MPLLMRPYRLGSLLGLRGLGLVMAVPSPEPSIPLNPQFNHFFGTPVITGPMSVVPSPQPTPITPVYLPNPDRKTFQSPSASLTVPVPTSDGQTPITSLAAAGPATANTIVVSPTGGPIPPPNTPIIAASSNPLMDFLTGSMFGGIPNWVLLGAGALLLMGGKK